MMGISIALHIVSVTIWVGGMFFAYVVLRPAAISQLEPPLRLNLWRDVFSRFFPWVWGIILVIPATGVMLMLPYGKPSQSPLFIHIMIGLGTLMILIFLHLYFAPFKKLKRRLDENDIPAAAKCLNQIRTLVGINTIIGVITIVVASAGRYHLV